MICFAGNDPEMEDFVPEEEGKEEGQELAELLQVAKADFRFWSDAQMFAD